MKTRQHGLTTTPHHPAAAGLPHPRSVPTIEPESETLATVEHPFAEGAYDAIDPDLRHRMISEAAYRLYEERGFADGYDIDDWLQAEEAIDHQLLAGRGSREAPGEQ
jgi:predicted acyl esterase